MEAAQDLVLEIPDEMVITAAKRAAVEHGNVKKMLTRTREVFCVVFNLNEISD